MRSVLLMAAALAAPLPALAHHSIAAVYDRNKEVTVEGVVSKVELINPHALLYVETPNAKGPGVTTWTLESRGVAGLERMGFGKDSLAIGEKVKATGYPAHGGGSSMWLQTLATTSGKTFSFVRR